MDICGIYKITSPTKRVYIGQTNNFKRRMVHYKNGLCKGQTRLYNSFLKYGVKNHEFEMIEECKEELLNEKERYWQERYDVLGRSGLNCRYQKIDGRSGKISEETKHKMSESQKGRVPSKKTRELWSRQRKGRKLSKEHIEILRKVHTNRKVSEDTRRKMSEAKKGWVPSEETREKMRKNRARQVFSKESLLKIGANHPNTKKVVDISTQEEYQSIRQAAIQCGHVYKTLNNWLNGISPNKSNLRLK